VIIIQQLGVKVTYGQLEVLNQCHTATWTYRVLDSFLFLPICCLQASASFFRQHPQLHQANCTSTRFCSKGDVDTTPIEEAIVESNINIDQMLLRAVLRKDYSGF
jgi:hypothetical protein